MESILARALEYTLKYWLKSFSRDQFKLQGRTAQLSNLDIDGDVLHASVGFPAALNVTTARVGKLEITLPSVSNVQYEPILVQIDRLDLVLEENVDADNVKSPTSAPASTSSNKGSGYGFADKIADGMTFEVGTVNLMIETRGGAKQHGSAIWSSPLASITIRNLLLYTTNENWQVVNLKEARDFSNNKNFIYVFKKLEWESLSVDLLPHPDMFMDARVASSSNQGDKRDDDGAKRLFFGGERFLEGISGEAYITVQRTEQNSPLGLEVQLHIPEAVCPSLSEPGLRALLRFLTGVYVCLNRGDVDLKAQQHSTEARGCSLVSLIVDHIFLCIKDADFQLELLMQSLFFSRASLAGGENTKTLSRIMLGGLFLRDTFSHPPCTLIQPSLRTNAQELLQVPEFGQNFCPPIYPLDDKHMKFSIGVPLISLHSLQNNPSPTPPKFASQTVIECQPLMINLQEESCFRISSFLADGIVVNPGDVLPDFSVNSFEFILKEFDLAVPLDMQKTIDFSGNRNDHSHSSFSGARLHVEDLYFSQSPSIKCTLLNLDTDPACFSLWEYQPIDASQKKWTTRASHLSISLETCDSLEKQTSSTDWYAGLWRCVEFHEVCFEAAMVTADGSPLLEIPPPEGVVRIGVACQQYISNTSAEQLFFVLDLYAYFGGVAEKLTKSSKGNKQSSESLGNKIIKKMPSDTAVSLALNNVRLKFLESSSDDIHGMPLVQFDGQGLFLKVSHRTLGGAFAVSTSLHWETVSIYCLDGIGTLGNVNVIQFPSEHDNLVNGNRYPQMRAVFWVDNQIKHQKKRVPFLDMTMVHVMPYDLQDTESHSLNASFKVNGVRLGGGISYTESLLHRFGIFTPDGGPGEGLLKGLKKLSSGPLAKLFQASPPIEANNEEYEALNKEDHGRNLEVRMPDDIDVCITFNNWLFALEGTQDIGGWLPHADENISRVERCWHTTFQSLQVKAKSNSESDYRNKKRLDMKPKFPVELITVGIEGVQALKPSTKDVNEVEKDLTFGNISDNGVDIEVCLVADEDDSEMEGNWAVENVKFSVKEPIEAIATKEEIEHFVSLCRSEVDSMGRIAAGMLRLLKLDKSLGQGTMDQLANLGSGSMHKILTPEKLSRRSSFTSSIGLTPRTPISNAMLNDSVESTITSLEVEILDLQSKCSTLALELSSSEDSQHVSDVKYLTDKLESMQNLLTKLRTLI